MNQFSEGDVVCIKGGKTRMTIWCIPNPENEIQCIWWEDGNFCNRVYHPESLVLVRHREISTLQRGVNVSLASGSNTFVVADIYANMLSLEDIGTHKEYFDKEVYLFDKVR